MVAPPVGDSLGVSVMLPAALSEAEPGSTSTQPTKDVGTWGTVFNMCSATLGAGALSLPYAFQHLGVLGGLCALLLTATAAHYSVVLLVSAIAHTGARSYEELTVRVFGKRMGRLVEVNIIIFCFGSVIAYTVAVGDLLEPLIALRAVRAVAPSLTGLIPLRWLLSVSHSRARWAGTHRRSVADSRAGHGYILGALHASTLTCGEALRPPMLVAFRCPLSFLPRRIGRRSRPHLPTAWSLGREPRRARHGDRGG